MHFHKILKCFRTGQKDVGNEEIELRFGKHATELSTVDQNSTRKALSISLKS